MAARTLPRLSVAKHLLAKLLALRRLHVAEQLVAHEPALIGRCSAELLTHLEALLGRHVLQARYGHIRFSRAAIALHPGFGRPGRVRNTIPVHSGDSGNSRNAIVKRRPRNAYFARRSRTWVARRLRVARGRDRDE